MCTSVASLPHLCRTHSPPCLRKTLPAGILGLSGQHWWHHGSQSEATTRPQHQFPPGCISNVIPGKGINDTHSSPALCSRYESSNTQFRLATDMIQLKQSSSHNIGLLSTWPPCAELNQTRSPVSIITCEMLNSPPPDLTISWQKYLNKHWWMSLCNTWASEWSRLFTCLRSKDNGLA